MSDSAPTHGNLGWIDLTVDNAETLKDFYRDVVGWQTEALAMDGYDDFVMRDSQGEATAGVCHRRGTNDDMPPVWMAYFVVQNLDESAARCTELGGKVLVGPKGSPGRYCVIEDPAGAICAIYEQPE